jgi:fructose-1,6-bisphosphatase/inositol monophosphatase family enzyme
MPLYRRLKECDVREKGPGEVVTAADELAEAILMAELRSILPDATVVGEEAVAKDPSLLDRLGSSLCWIVDPLDGTCNFASGQGPFGIMVALAEAGKPIGGWILDPVSGRFCHATCGAGAWIGAKQVERRPVRSDLPRLAISTLYADTARREQLSGLLADRYDVVPMPRCAAHQYPSIALGESDIALYARTLPWDHAAGAIFLNESGGRVARLDGSPYLAHDPQPNMIAASSPRLWDEFAKDWHMLPECVG